MKVRNVIHEYGMNGQHRIVLIDEVDDLHPGEWAAFTALAKNRGYLAATEYYTDDLPQGIFKVTNVAHKTVSA